MKKIIVFILFVSIIMGCNQPAKETQKEITPENKMEWWREARFGMFIHWGLYAIPAGKWEGEEVPGISEWILKRAKIPVKDYKELAKEFNPVKYNAEEWVKLAKAAGMKYIVITSKHHEGFALFDSEASDFNVVDATPYGKDLLKDLADACKKHDIRLGFYYSQAQDWTEPGGTYPGLKDGKNEPHWDSTLVREPLMSYINGKAVPQVKEILENYGGLDILWWDTPFGMTEEAANALKKVTDEYPALITNNRLYDPWPGDFSTPEQHVPPTGLDYDWEVCMTMNTSWGYKSSDNNWKSSKTLIQMLADIASKGGNLLLNVGPTALGEIPDSSVERLQQIGQWMDKNSESIYGTTASPFFKLTWGRCTRKDDKLYLHVFEQPEDGILTVPGIKANIEDAYLLADASIKLNYELKDNDLLIQTSEIEFDPYNTVLVLDTDGTIEVESNMPTLKGNTIELSTEFADIHNHGYGKHAVLKGKGKEAVIENWVDHRAKIEWMFNNPDSCTYTVFASLKAKEAGKLEVSLDEEELYTEIKPIGIFEKVRLGEINVGVGDKVIQFKAANNKWKGAELKGVELVRVQ